MNKKINFKVEMGLEQIFTRSPIQKFYYKFQNALSVRYL